MAKISLKNLSVAARRSVSKRFGKNRNGDSDGIQEKLKGVLRFISRRALPIIISTSLVILLLVVGIFAGIMFSNGVSTAMQPFTVSNETSCNENPAEQRKELARIISGDNSILEAAVSAYNFAETFFQIRQVRAGCETDLDFEAAEGWTWPIDANPPITSSMYGWRTHPLGGDRRFHWGTDYPYPCGTPILAANDGFVEATYYDNSAGYAIRIKHDFLKTGASYTRYYHLTQNSFLVNPGDEVLSGQPIGLVGTTGSSTGCHLHFEISIGIYPFDFRVDPHKFIQDRIILQRGIDLLTSE